MITIAKKAGLVFTNLPEYFGELRGFNNTFWTKTEMKNASKKLKAKIVRFLETQEDLKKRDAEIFKQKSQRDNLLLNISEAEKKLNSLKNQQGKAELDPLNQMIDYDEMISSGARTQVEIDEHIKKMEDHLEELDTQLNQINTSIENGLFLLKRDALEFKKELSKKENQGILTSAKAKSIRLGRSLAAVSTFKDAANGFQLKARDLLSKMPSKPTGDEIVFICEEDGIYDSIILLSDERFVVSINSNTNSIRIAVIDDIKANQQTILGEGHSFYSIVWNSDIDLSRFTYEDREWSQDDLETFGEDLITLLYRQMEVCENITPEQEKEMRETAQYNKAIEGLSKLARDKEEKFTLNYRSLLEA